MTRTLNAHVKNFPPPKLQVYTSCATLQCRTTRRRCGAGARRGCPCLRQWRIGWRRRRGCRSCWRQATLRGSKASMYTTVFTWPRSARAASRSTSAASRVRRRQPSPTHATSQLPPQLPPELLPRRAERRSKQPSSSTIRGGQQMLYGTQHAQPAAHMPAGRPLLLTPILYPIRTSPQPQS